MAVAFDAKGSLNSGASSAATSVTGTPITVSSGSNRALAVCLNFGGATALPTGISVTWNGVAMTPITNTSVLGPAPLALSGIWYGLVNPASGANTLTASWTG